MDSLPIGKYAHPIEEVAEKMQKSFSIEEEDTETYHRYLKDGKDAARQGNLSAALELFKSAYAMHASAKLKGRITKIEEALKEMENEESGAEEDFVNVNQCGLILFKDLHDKLYDHQKEGVAFLYGLHRDGKKGCILADDMGLGKTIQIIAFLSGMYDNELVKQSLLIMPTTLLSIWKREFTKWTPGMRVKVFHGSKAERDRNLQRVQRKGGVLITTYNMLLSNWERLSSYNGREFPWDYVILDEAHKIKTSSTKTAKCAQAIPAKHRILLTGTPVQNNLSELWALFNFALQGALLGTAKTFKSEYENPITRARERDATPGEKALGLKISENLMAIINPYFLRRTKQEVHKIEINDTDGCKSAMNIENENENHSAAGLAMPTLTRKNDLIVWTYLSQVQEDIYRQFISLEHIKELLMTTRSPLAELTILKKLCDHPRLLPARAVAQLGLEEGINPKEHHDENESAICRIDHVPDETLVSESGKLTFLVALLGRLRQEGHRTLVFSQSRKMLDIIERVLTNQGFKLMRIDGTVIHLPERERRIALFQTNKQYTVFLLTTQVGGVGITLTGANRVVIFDPSWNPATDAQAVDRAYRIGQTLNVVIYRLITCGTVEEKIYRRQVFKDSLIRQTTGDKKNPFRYFSQQQLKELFKLEDTRSSSTQLQLQSLHSRQRHTDSELDGHIAYLHSMEMFGISDHDLMFSHDAAVHEDHPEDQESQCYIEHRVLKAQELMKAESELQRQFLENIASNTEPAYLRNPGLGKKSTESKPVNVQPANSPDYIVISPAVVDLTRSLPDPDECVHNLSNNLGEFDLDCSTDSKESPEQDKIKEEMCSRNLLTVIKSLSEVHSNAEFEVVDSSVPEDDKRMTSAYGDDYSVLSVQDSADVDELEISDHGAQSCKSVDLENAEVLPIIQNASDLDTNVDEYDPAVQCRSNSEQSVLQESDMDNEGYFKESWKSNSELESFQGHFNLQLEDSAEETLPEKVNGSLVEENPGLKLHMEASLSTEREQSLTTNISADCIGEDPAEEPFFMYRMKKKTRQVIYDSEDEENYNDGDGNLCFKTSFNEPLKGMECSTPKPVKSANSLLSFTPHRKSIGLNTSVASRRSLVETLLDDVEDLLQDMDTEEAEQSGDASESTGSESESVMEEEEPSGETMNTESEEKGTQSSFVHSSEAEMTDGDGPLEESIGDYELAPGESMEQKQGDGVATTSNSKSAHVPDEYERLVGRGKICYSAGKLKEALDLFLKAIDIRSGDPEIQLLTIQLYRQLSQL